MRLWHWSFHIILCDVLLRVQSQEDAKLDSVNLQCRVIQEQSRVMCGENKYYRKCRKIFICTHFVMAEEEFQCYQILVLNTFQVFYFSFSTSHYHVKHTVLHCSLC